MGRKTHNILTDRQKAHIADAYHRNVSSQQELATLYGISKSVVGLVIKQAGVAKRDAKNRYKGVE